MGRKSSNRSPQVDRNRSAARQASRQIQIAFRFRFQGDRFQETG